MGVSKQKNNQSWNDSFQAYMSGHNIDKENKRQKKKEENPEDEENKEKNDEE